MGGGVGAQVRDRETWHGGGMEKGRRRVSMG